MQDSNLPEKENSKKASKIERISAAAGAVGILAGSAVVAYFNPVSAGFFPQCPLHSLTGLNCPGCGLTRGFHALFNGDILTALHFNALLPIFLFLFAYVILLLFSVALRGRTISFRGFSPNVFWAFLIIALVFGVVRNLPFYPFNLLAI